MVACLSPGQPTQPVQRIPDPLAHPRQHQAQGCRSTSAGRARPCTELPAASAILSIAVSGRCRTGGTRPAGARRGGAGRALAGRRRPFGDAAGRLADVSCEVPRGRARRGLRATSCQATPHVIAAQVDHRLVCCTGPAGPDRLRRQPDQADRSIATQTNARLADFGGADEADRDPRHRRRPERARARWPCPADHDVVGGFRSPTRTDTARRSPRLQPARRASAGVSPGSPVFSVRIFNSTGDSSSDVVVKAITAAVQTARA